MGTTNSTTVNASTAARLRDEYGPAPWWSASHLRTLLDDEGLTPGEIAGVWNVTPETVRERAREYGIRGRSV